MWNNSYDGLLSEWSELRTQAQSIDFEDALHLVHNWWSKAPITSPYLHILDCETWPLPWELLEHSAFCDLAKSIGICYTLILLNRDEIKSLHIAQTDNYTVVQVNDGQYTLNDQMGEIVTDQSELHIKHLVDAMCLKNKIQ